MDCKSFLAGTRGSNHDFKSTPGAMNQLQGSHLAFSDLAQSASLREQLAAASYCFSNKRHLGLLHRINFLRSWRLLSGMQKAIPGFSPAEYAKLWGLDSSVDSTLHFLRNGSPSGSWLKKVIASDSPAISATTCLLYTSDAADE